MHLQPFELPGAAPGRSADQSPPETGAGPEPRGHVETKRQAQGNLRPAGEELDALIDLVVAGQGKRIMPSLLSYMRERQARRDRWVGGLQSSRVPIMLVDGEADPVSGGHLADRWADLLPDRPLVRLESIGHWPQLEDPDAVVAAARTFFSRD